MGEDNEEVVRLYQFKQWPVDNKRRSCTNVFCLIIGIIFSLALIVIAAVLFKKSTFYSFTLPTDSSGKLCGYDYPNHPYVFFTAAPLIQSRVCVSKCPVKGDSTTSCKTNNLVTSCIVSPLAAATNTFAQQTMYGDFCWPVDPTLEKQIQKNSNMGPRIQFFQSLDGVKITLIAVLVFSIIFWLLVQFLTQCTNYVIMPACVVVMVFAINLVEMFSTNDTRLKKALFIGLIVFAVLIVLSVFKNCNSMRLHAIFLKAASQVFKWRKSMLLYIIMYLIILVLLVALVLFQFVGFWSNGRKIFLPAQYVYYKIEGFKFSTGVAVLLAIQLLWGISFIKQSYNFCLGGNAIQWYFEQSLTYKQQSCSPLLAPLKWKFTKHFGSIVACSFMTTFFTLFDFLFDMIKPVKTGNCYATCFGPTLGWFHILGDLVRSDALALVAVNGSAYWQSSMYNQEMTGRNPLNGYFQFSSRVFSLSAHCLMVSLAIIFAVYFPKITSMFDMILIVGGSLLISTCFVTFHLDIAQTLHIIYLLDQSYLTSEKGQLRQRGESDGVSVYRSNLAVQVQAIYFEENVPIS